MNQKDRVPRTFLDTSTLNFIVDHYENIFEGTVLPLSLDQEAIKDITALGCAFARGRRSPYELAISPYTYAEVLATSNDQRRCILQDWLRPIWDKWIGTLEHDEDLPTLPAIERFKIQTHLLFDLHSTLPKVPDRILVIDALLYKCDYFCTRDRRTMLNFSDRLYGLTTVLQRECEIAARRVTPLRIVSPAQWWEDLITTGRL